MFTITGDRQYFRLLLKGNATEIISGITKVACGNINDRQFCFDYMVCSHTRGPQQNGNFMLHGGTMSSIPLALPFTTAIFM